MTGILNSKIAFFGTPELAVIVLEELKKAGFTPSLVVTNPDAPKGRKLVMTPPPVKVWAEKERIQVLQPATLKDGAVLNELKKTRWDLFIVAAYGKIIPKEIIDLPLHNTLNVHPSLLPKFRGASPIISAILEDEKETGVSIMILDELMDHGPVIAQEKVTFKEWPQAPEAEKQLAEIGGRLLAETIPKWISRDIEAVPQEHHLATFTKKITKADGLIDFKADPYLNFRKIQAFAGWPGTYFFVDIPEKDVVKQVRVVIKSAEFKGGELIIKTVVPEGKKEMKYEDFLKFVPKKEA